MIITLPSYQDKGELDPQLFTSLELDGRHCPELIAYNPSTLDMDINGVIHGLAQAGDVSDVELRDAMVSYSLGPVASMRPQRPGARMWHPDYGRVLVAQYGALPTQVLQGDLDLAYLKDKQPFEYALTVDSALPLITRSSDELLRQAGAEITHIPSKTAIELGLAYHRSKVNRKRHAVSNGFIALVL